MNTAALNEHRANLAAVCMALEAEGLTGVARALSDVALTFFKEVEAPGLPAIDWAAVSRRLEMRAAAMTKENLALTPAARNTPFGVMTGTATIVLDMLAEALGLGVGLPTNDRIEDVMAALRADRLKLVMDRANKGRP